MTRAADHDVVIGEMPQRLDLGTGSSSSHPVIQVTNESKTDLGSINKLETPHQGLPKGLPSGKMLHATEGRKEAKQSRHIVADSIASSVSMVSQTPSTKELWKKHISQTEELHEMLKAYLSKMSKKGRKSSQNRHDKDQSKENERRQGGEDFELLQKSK